MSSKVLFSCDYPIYSVGRLQGDSGGGSTEFYVAGGGERAKTGIPNSLDIHRLSVDSGGSGYVTECVLHHDMGSGVIMNSATHPTKPHQMAVGVGDECHALEVTDQKSESTKRESKVKRREKSKTDEEETGRDRGSTEGVAPSYQLVVKSQRKTDYSSEPYQKTVEFTTTGDRVVTGGSDGVIRVWKYPSLDKVCELKGHETEIETLSCHPSKQQVVSMCRGGRAVVWDLTNEEEEHSFTWAPGHQHNRPSQPKPDFRFRASCFSPVKKEESEDTQTCFYTLTIPMDTRSKQKKWCYLVKWDTGAWIVDDETSTGTELLSALAIDPSGKHLGVGTIGGAVLIYSSDLRLLSRVAGVHAVFITGLLFLPLPMVKKKPHSSSLKPVSKQEKLVLISVSADRTCSATPVIQKSGEFEFICRFIFITLMLLLIAVLSIGTRL